MKGGLPDFCVLTTYPEAQKMAHAQKKKSSKNDSNDFASLREFFSAYLHEEFNDEYGSAAVAARAFVQDAGSEELATTQREWQRWRDQSRGKQLPEIQADLRKLGAAWLPETAEELDRVGAALNKSLS
jgi:hypothetical protein